MTDLAPIAVIIPLYDKGPHIARALNSVLAQEVQPTEIIVIDDASSDDGVSQVLAFTDPRIRLVRRSEPGPGGYAARNAGIEAARSEWIAFLDADDEWRPSAMAEVTRLIGQADDKVSCIFTGYARQFGDGVLHPSIFSRTSSGDRRLTFSDFVDVWLETGQSPMWTSAVVARRSALLEAGLFPAGKCNRGGDKDTWVRLMTVGDALCNPVVTATYHLDSVNMVTRNTNTNQRPYLCSTFEAVLPGGDEGLKRRIRRLINWEMYCHARDAWRVQTRISRSLFSGFIVRQNPGVYLLLSSMAAAPDWLLQATYGLKALVRRRKRRAA